MNLYVNYPYQDDYWLASAMLQLKYRYQSQILNHFICLLLFVFELLELFPLLDSISFYTNY